MAWIGFPYVHLSLCRARVWTRLLVSPWCKILSLIKTSFILEKKSISIYLPLYSTPVFEVGFTTLRCSFPARANFEWSRPLIGKLSLLSAAHLTITRWIWRLEKLVFATSLQEKSKTPASSNFQGCWPWAHELEMRLATARCRRSKQCRRLVLTVFEFGIVYPWKWW